MTKIINKYTTKTRTNQGDLCRQTYMIASDGNKPRLIVKEIILTKNKDYNHKSGYRILKFYKGHRLVIKINNDSIENLFKTK